MPHPLVEQLRFTRSEWQRALAGLTDEDARRRLPPMNCISWMLGHLAYHEHAWWLALAQGKGLDGLPPDRVDAARVVVVARRKAAVMVDRLVEVGGVAQASRARRSPENCQRASAGKKLR